MATAEIALSNGAWTKLVDAGDEFIATFDAVAGVEVAVSDTETAPTVQGHRVDASRLDGVTRGVIGPGYVYARTVGSLSTQAAKAIVTAWSSS